MKELLILINGLKSEIKNKILGFKQKLFQIRIGKINESILDDVTIDLYGKKVQIKTISNISILDARTLLITPWEEKNINILYKAFIKNSILYTPYKTGKVLKLKMAQLTEETRKELIKKINFILEIFKINLRKLRKKTIKKLNKINSLEKDCLKKNKIEIQNIINDCINYMKIISNRKKKEILTI
ncbi:MAG: ribosome recycling factor [Candidatus Karelsulcia muelleri]